MQIGILGARGRMGQMLVGEISSGRYPATVGAEVDVGGDQDAAFRSCDVLIDFTSPAACLEHAALAHQYKKPLVIGTTGLGAVEEAALLVAAKNAPLLRAANMSLGVTLLLSLVEKVAAQLGNDFDIEIFEAHHRHKVDAPSGTALALGKAAARGRGVHLEDALASPRSGNTGPRIPGSIGMSVFRGGDIVGDHSVTFAGMGERLEFTHKASDRSIFAKGAVRAALWLVQQPAGLYSMADVLKA